MKKKICIVTGTRADFGHYNSVLKVLRNSFDVSLIVCGMHLTEYYGCTIEEVEKTNVRIADKIDFIFESNTLTSMSRSVGVAVLGITQTLEREHPDILMLLGDRGEMIAGAIAAAYMNIPIAHLHGGEISGSVDNSIRHAITKLAHIHLVPHEEAKNYVLKIGENPKYVFNVGAPSLDTISNLKEVEKKAFYKKYSLDLNESYILFVLHPDTHDFESIDIRIAIISEWFKKTRMQTIWIKSNSDCEGKIINNHFDMFSKRGDHFKGYSNLPYPDYLNLMKNARLMIGNSSSGIIEAPSFKLPVINLGNRQKDRIRAKNVLDVGFNLNEIDNAYKKIMENENFRKTLRSVKNPYGEGGSAKKILNVLVGLSDRKTLINSKYF